MKIDGILQMQKPKNLLQMHGFLGAVNHYQCMWQQRTHILAPLSSESVKKHFFRHLKWILSSNT